MIVDAGVSDQDGDVEHLVPSGCESFVSFHWLERLHALLLVSQYIHSHAVCVIQTCVMFLSDLSLGDISIYVCYKCPVTFIGFIPPGCWTDLDLVP